MRSSASSAPTRASACTSATASRRSRRCCRRAEKRGLALIDPPYEDADGDFARVAAALVDAAARWPQGVVMAWYPIKQGFVAARLHRRLVDAGVKRLLAAELCVHPDDSRAGLNGSGIVTVNPPWQFEQDLRQVLPRAARNARRARRGPHARRSRSPGIERAKAPVDGVEDRPGDAVDVGDSGADDRDRAFRRRQHDARGSPARRCGAAPRSCDAAASAR